MFNTLKNLFVSSPKKRNESVFLSSSPNIETRNRIEKKISNFSSSSTNRKTLTKSPKKSTPIDERKLKKKGKKSTKNLITKKRRESIEDDFFFNLDTSPTPGPSKLTKTSSPKVRNKIDIKSPLQFPNQGSPIASPAPQKLQPVSENSPSFQKEKSTIANSKSSTSLFQNLQHVNEKLPSPQKSKPVNEKSGSSTSLLQGVRPIVELISSPAQTPQHRRSISPVPSITPKKKPRKSRKRKSPKPPSREETLKMFEELTGIHEDPTQIKKRKTIEAMTEEQWREYATKNPRVLHGIQINLPPKDEHVQYHRFVNEYTVPAFRNDYGVKVINVINRPPPITQYTTKQELNEILTTSTQASPHTILATSTQASPPKITNSTSPPILATSTQGSALKISELIKARIARDKEKRKKKLEMEKEKEEKDMKEKELIKNLKEEEEERRRLQMENEKRIQLEKEEYEKKLQVQNTPVVAPNGNHKEPSQINRGSVIIEEPPKIDQGSDIIEEPPKVDQSSDNIVEEGAVSRFQYHSSPQSSPLIKQPGESRNIVEKLLQKRQQEKQRVEKDDLEIQYDFGIESQHSKGKDEDEEMQYDSHDPRIKARIEKHIRVRDQQYIEKARKREDSEIQQQEYGWGMESKRLRGYYEDEDKDMQDVTQDSQSSGNEEDDMLEVTQDSQMRENEGIDIQNVIQDSQIRENEAKNIQTIAQDSQMKGAEDEDSFKIKNYTDDSLRAIAKTTVERSFVEDLVFGSSPSKPLPQVTKIESVDKQENNESPSEPSQTKPEPDDKHEDNESPPKQLKLKNIDLVDKQENSKAEEIENAPSKPPLLTTTKPVDKQENNESIEKAQHKQILKEAAMRRKKLARGHLEYGRFTVRLLDRSSSEEIDTSEIQQEQDQQQQSPKSDEEIEISVIQQQRPQPATKSVSESYKTAEEEMDEDIENSDEDFYKDMKTKKDGIKNKQHSDQIEEENNEVDQKDGVSNQVSDGDVSISLASSTQIKTSNINNHETKAVENIQPPILKNPEINNPKSNSEIIGKPKRSKANASKARKKARQARKK
ncbi:unnamed protein product [Candida verbasci]|uniref:Uncharacterized protein n=1 Tax=Candida verbasci TaxID=1227364 RepID=A0A9W4TZ99_9ASCO|nr:unnamed protein product [Candida verbasci]